MEYKICESEVKEFDEKDLTVVHWISTESIDRGGDLLHADGMKMDGKVVVLKSHGRDPKFGDTPIARPIWIKSGNNSNGVKGLLAKTQFYPGEAEKDLWKRTTGGWMPFWSIGWNPIEQENKTKNGVNYRDVPSWWLYEYSICGVGMQQEAVTPDKTEPIMSFKVLPCLCDPQCNENSPCKWDKYGELIAWQNRDGVWEEKPFPNEHSCRLESPDKYIRIRRQNDKFGKGIHAIWGVQGGGKPVELQAIRFSKDKFTPVEARKWLKDHEYKCKLFEPASEKCEVCGEDKVFKWDFHDREDKTTGAYICEHCHGMRKICERWNKSLPKLFDLEIDNRPPANWEYDLYKKFLKCEIKNIFLNSYQIPSPLLGTYLAGIKQLSERFQLLDTRNFTSDGLESPPIREVIKLNSKKSDDFLIEGIQFFNHKEIPLILKFIPNWCGISIAVITNKENNSFNKNFLEEIHQWVKENNFLKGERFALSGEFIEKTEDGWNDLILDEELTAIIKNGISQINSKKGEMKSRGLLFVGRPGTGKTKAGRTIMNHADSTFIWVSSKDFRYGSAVGMISLAFSLAKDLNPAIIFMEDIDTWIGNYLVDLLKTEMDGLRQNKGIITILTSNNPENLPDALLDRPGRFHHVLDFKLPDYNQRLSMIKLWIDEKIGESIIVQIVKETNGFSGSHIRELVDFAKIISEENKIDMGKAIQESLRRLMRQRALINQIRENKKSYILPELDDVEAKGLIRYKKIPLAKEDEPWDGPGERAKAEVEDLKIMCAYYINEGENKGDYKLPHHKAGGEHACVWNGVRASAAAIMGARGANIPSADVTGSKTHIAHHYGDFDKGDPPWKGKDGLEFIEKIQTIREVDKKGEVNIYPLAKQLIPDLAEFFDPDRKQDDWGDEGNEEPADLLQNEDVSFVFIDGDKIRDEDEIDFAMGGTHYAYPDLIPEEEIWIDERMVDEDIMAVKCHEFVERQLMKYWGFGYDQAHNVGNWVEKIIRHVTDPEDDGGGEHNGDHRHWWQHSGDHFHEHGMTGTWDSDKERLIWNSLLPICHAWGEMKKLGQHDGECTFDPSCPTCKRPMGKCSKHDKAMTSRISEMDKAINNFIEVTKKHGLDIPKTSGEPGPDDKIQADNPPEPKRVLIVNSEEEQRRAEESRRNETREMLRPVALQIEDTLKKIPEIVREELDRIRGKVK